MNLQSAGQLADVITSAVTILTLVYLAFQIRANTASQRVDSARASQAQTGTYVGILAQCKENSRVFRVGLDDISALDADEQYQFFFLFGLIAAGAAHTYKEHKLKMIDEDDFQRQIRTPVEWLKTPGGRIFWQINSASFANDFAQLIEKRLAA